MRKLWTTTPQGKPHLMMLLVLHTLARTRTAGTDGTAAGGGRGTLPSPALGKKAPQTHVPNTPPLGHLPGMTLLMSGMTRLSWMRKLKGHPPTHLRVLPGLCILLHLPVHRLLALPGTYTLLVHQLVVDHLGSLLLLVHQTAQPVCLDLLVHQPLQPLFLLGLWTPDMPGMGGLLPDPHLLVDQEPVDLRLSLWGTLKEALDVLEGCTPAKHWIWSIPSHWPFQNFWCIHPTANCYPSSS